MVTMKEAATKVIAENQYHAEKYGELLGIFNSSAIISNAGVGESGNAELYEGEFKDKDGSIY